jgi:hypothetical protein
MGVQPKEGAAQQDAPVGEARAALTAAPACLTIQRGGGVGNIYDSGINNNGSNSNNNSGTSSTIPIGLSGSPATARQELMQIDLSVFPPGQSYQVTQAQLSLYMYPNSANQMINIHQATAAWSETTVSWPSFNEQFVAAAAATFNAGPQNPFNPLNKNPPPPNNVRVDITSLLSGWLNGTFPNDGMLLEQPPVNGVSTIMLTSEWPPTLSGYHPELFTCFVVTCFPGTADCNHIGTDGCETDITTVQNCGACGNVCNEPNATAACVNGACAVGSCNKGFGDCNGDPSDGCETMLTTNTDCGGCGVPCALPNGSASCASGTCTLTACNPGYFDCDGNPADGCEPLPCGNGQHCAVAADCSSGVCTGGFCASPTCSDGVQNENETDVDCGGVCPPCANGKDCASAADCQSGVCTGGVCQVPTCSDGVQNGTETDVDCGGASCPECSIGEKCSVDYDCTSGVCVAGTCQAPSCNDGVQNGSETGVDCGGGVCPPCNDGIGCTVGSDCASGVCTSASSGNQKGGGSNPGICQVPNCQDGVQNGSETGPDCGGPCAPCITCAHDSDCPAGDTCDNGYCHAPACTGYGLGTILCGIGACQVQVPSCVNGQPNTCTPGTPTAEVCGDGLDNNCNGEIDEGCACVNGATQPCYTGAAATLGVGACHAGTQTCMHGQWGACVGEVTPSEEICDGIDNNCDDQVDEDLGTTTCGGAGCTVTVQNCVGGVVQTCDAHQVDGQACDDGNACTQTDTCQAGTCTGSNPVICAASDQCHVAGVCNPANGQCSNPNKADGSACDDGNACTQTDTCQSGVCTGSNPVVCAASDQCHVAGVCNPANGQCSNPNKADGSACNDGNACTSNDVCTNGVCGGTAYTCAAPDQCHQAGTCNGDGTCSFANKANGTACNDGNACTQTDTCQNGTCTGSNPVVCTPLDQCHTAGVCNTSTGVCSNPNQPNGTACNDGNACTRTDTCQAGVCTGSNPVVCTASDQCHVAGVCNPANGTCSNPSAPNGTACNDSNACTKSDVCTNGSCAGTPYSCAPPGLCQFAGSCNGDGTCSYQPIINGTPEGGSQACTTGLPGVCSSGHTFCNGSGALTCVQNTAASTDICDGLDNDCNGNVDNDLDEGFPNSCNGDANIAVASGTSVTVEGKTNSGTADYIYFTFEGVGGAPSFFHPKISITSSDPNNAYVMNVQANGCSGSFCGNITTWEMTYNQYLDSTDCSNLGNCSDGVARQTVVVVEVLRTSGSAPNKYYTVTASNCNGSCGANYATSNNGFGEGNSNTCGGAATYLVAPGTVQNISGRLNNNGVGQDYINVNFTSVGGAPSYFHPKIDLIGDSAEYRINVQTAGCGGSFCGNLTTWEMIYNQYLDPGDCQNLGNCSDGVPRQTFVTVEVLRVASGNSCTNYTIQASNL